VRLMQNARTPMVTMLALSTIGLAARAAHSTAPLGPRPFYGVDQMEAGTLKGKLAACVARIERDQPHDLSIGHRCCDLGTTTNILAGDLASTGRVSFIRAEFDPNGNRVKADPAHGCTTDLTFAEFKRLKGKTDISNPNASTVEAFLRQTTLDALTNDGDLLHTIDVLAQDVGIIGLFSDWPATTTFDANGLN
jgi:hypothetical protein